MFHNVTSTEKIGITGKLPECAFMLYRKMGRSFAFQWLMVISSDMSEDGIFVLAPGLMIP